MSSVSLPAPNRMLPEMSGAAAPLAAAIWRTTAPVAVALTSIAVALSPMSAALVMPIWPLFWIRPSVPEWSTMAAAGPLLHERGAAIMPLLVITFTVGPAAITIACAADPLVPAPVAVTVPLTLICGT